MVELPSGTVTLLFTDVEGRYECSSSSATGTARVLADRRRILRAVFDEPRIERAAARMLERVR